jgi:dTDP-glucose 4,6-dehydratase
MDKILVTGADGFIGSHLVEKLVKIGYGVKAFVMYNSFNSWGWLDNIDAKIKKSIEVVSGDIRDPFFVDSVIQDCDAVIHLAALIAIPFSYQSPSSYINTNINGTLNVLQAAKNNRIKKVIHTSTSEVYGSAQYVPIDENHPISGQSPYAATKIAADQIALSFYKSFETPVSIIRPFNTYGPRQSNRAIIPTVITQILNGKKEVNVGNISPTRDFSYIDDTVDGFIATLQTSKIVGEIINLGAGFEISIKETIDIIIKIIGKEVKIIHENKRIRAEKSEVNRLFSNNTLAKNILNWEPIYGDKKGFTKGLEKTINWFSDSNNSSKYKHDIYNI